jgi:hypothetical protein
MIFQFFCWMNNSRQGCDQRLVAGVDIEGESKNCTTPLPGQERQRNASPCDDRVEALRRAHRAVVLMRPVVAQLYTLRGLRPPMSASD